MTLLKDRARTADLRLASPYFQPEPHRPRRSIDRARHLTSEATITIGSLAQESSYDGDVTPLMRLVHSGATRAVAH